MVELQVEVVELQLAVDVVELLRSGGIRSSTSLSVEVAELLEVARLQLEA